MTFAERSAMIWLDANADAGNFVFAFIKKVLPGHDRPQLLYTICDDAVHQEWMEATVLSELTDSFSKGDFPIPGYQPKSKVLPENMLEAEPPKPSLNCLIWMQDDPETKRPKGVAIPQSMLEKYKTHSVFAQEFDTFFKEVEQRCGLPDHWPISMISPIRRPTPNQP